MPIVTLTCKDRYFPADEKVGYEERTLEQFVVFELANIVPVLFAHYLNNSFLSEDVDPNSVLVDIRKFHSASVNTPDLWVRVELGIDTSEVLRTSIAWSMRYRILNWLRQLKDGIPTLILPSWQLDLFFGPIHGSSINAKGILKQYW
jgi:hypothetical protein